MKTLLFIAAILFISFIGQAQEIVRVMIIGKKQNGCGVMYSATKFRSELCKLDDADFVEAKLKNEIGNSLNLHSKRVYAGQFYAVIKATYQPFMMNCTYTDYSIGVSTSSKVDAIEKAKSFMNSRSGQVVSYELKFDGQVPLNKPITTMNNEQSTFDVNLSPEEWNELNEKLHGESNLLFGESNSGQIVDAKIENGKWGFVDKFDKWLAEPKYDNFAIDYKEGFIFVNVGGNAELYQEDFETISEFMEETGGKWGVISDYGKELIPTIYSSIELTDWLTELYFTVTLNGKVGAFDKNGKKILSTLYDSFIFGYYEGLMLVKIKGKWGFIDKNENIVIHPVYDYLHRLTNDNNRPFECGVVWVNIGGNMTVGGKWGLIDAKGKEIFPVKYDQVSLLKNTLSLVRLNEKFGLISCHGVELLPAVYDKIMDTEFNEDGINFIKKEEKWGFYDRFSKITLQPKYDKMWSFSNGLSLFLSNDKYGFVNKKGHEIVPPIYTLCQNFNENRAYVSDGSKVGFIDTSGKVVIPLIYDKATNWFSEGLVVVVKDKLCGYLDVNGEVKIPLIYSSASNFSEGLGAVKLNGKWGFVDKSGKVIVPIEYDSVQSFQNGKALVKLNGVEFYIDKQGNKFNN